MDETKIYRKCISCNCIKPRTELIKITINKATKELRISPSSNFVGRSLYICKNFSCIDTAFKKGRIYKILKIKPDETFKEKIRAVLEN